MESTPVNPYEAPSAPLPLDSPTLQDRRFREMKIFAWLAAACISISFPYTLIIVLLWNEIVVLPMETLELIDQLYLIVFLLGVVFYCIWKYRCASNAIYFYGGPINYTPGWCVGYYFIPIVMWFRPYQCMKDIYEKTYLIFGQKSPNVLVLTWWLAWVISSLFGNVASRVEEPFLLILNKVISLPSAILVLWVIFTLTRRQYEIIQDPELAAKIGTLNPYRGALPNVSGVAMRRATLPEARNSTNSPSQ